MKTYKINYGKDELLEVFADGYVVEGNILKFYTSDGNKRKFGFDAPLYSIHWIEEPGSTDITIKY